VGLGDRGSATPSRLSGGEQQRVAFAAALAPRPRFLLADEPTAELDERTAAELVALLQSLVRREGATAIVVTHDALVERMADRIVYVRDGRAIAMRVGAGAPAEPIVDASGWRAPDLPPPARSMAPVPPAEGSVPAVVVEGLSRTYGSGQGAIHAVKDLDATFASGGLHIVTGPSGSGKSTLLRLVAGLDRPTAGRVLTLGTDLATLDREALAEFRAKDVAFCPQAPRLVPFLSALENVELALAIRRAGDDAAARAARAQEALGQVGLADLAMASPDTLSGGERVRVAIARAVAARPRLLILDEPTAALDRASATSLIEMLAALDRQHVTMVVATHDRDLIAAASDRLDLRDARRG
jgi:ABC-type lipoprotein export system ATPase subunit